MLVTLCMLPLLLGPFVAGSAIDGSTGSADRCAWEAYTKCTRPELFNKMRQAPLFSETKEGQTEFMCPENDAYIACMKNLTSECHSPAYYQYMTFQYFLQKLYDHDVCIEKHPKEMMPGVLEIVTKLPNSSRADLENSSACGHGIIRQCQVSWVHYVRSGGNSCRFAINMYLVCMMDLGTCRAPNYVAFHEYLQKYQDDIKQFFCPKYVC